MMDADRELIRFYVDMAKRDGLTRMEAFKLWGFLLEDDVRGKWHVWKFDVWPDRAGGE
jgi:hypothetical protein